MSSADSVSQVREACLEGVRHAIPEVVAIVSDSGASASARVSAFDKLARIGLAGQEGAHRAEPAFAQVCIRVAFEVFRPTPEMLEGFVKRIGHELAVQQGLEEGGTASEIDDADGA